MESPPKMIPDVLTFRFPGRLWRIVNSCSSGAISWGPTGKTIQILRKKFEEDYLSGENNPFKTTKYESFVRQLNHYGFKKVQNRMAMQMISTSMLQGMSKEDAATLSEYHNPNFIRGEPERLTFLERRNQSQGITGQRRRTKVNIASHSTHNDCPETAPTTKKIKKEKSVEVSQNSLLLVAQAGPSNSEGSIATGLKGKQKTRTVPTQTSASLADVRAPTSRNMPLNQHPMVEKGIDPTVPQHAAEGQPERADDQMMDGHRPSGQESLDPRYMAPSLLPSLSGRKTQARHHQPFQPPQMYGHGFNAYGMRYASLPLTYPPGYPNKMRVTSPDTHQFQPPFFPDNRRFPMGPPGAWNAIHRMPGHQGVLMPGYNDAGRRVRWSQNSHESGLFSHHGRHMVDPEPNVSWHRSQINRLEPGAGYPWSSSAFVTRTSSVPTVKNEPRALMSTKEYDSPRDLHTGFGHLMPKQDSTCNFSQKITFMGPTAMCQTSMKQEEEYAMPVNIQEARKEESNGHGLSHEQEEEDFTATVQMVEGDGQGFADALNTTMNDAMDLPLDVVEETVVTYTIASASASDHSFPLSQTSPAEQKLTIDNNLNSSAFSPADNLASFRLPSENATADNDQSNNGTSCPNSPASETGNCHQDQWPKVEVRREESGDLAFMSSATAHEFLSAALKNPGTTIMMDDDCDSERLVLVIPKGNK